jgi:hypothetical protein
MTPEERRADDERFRKVTPPEQIHEVEDLLEELEDAINEAERVRKKRH